MRLGGIICPIFSGGSPLKYRLRLHHFKIVRWARPQCWKFNVDGSSLTYSRAGCGIIVCDFHGEVLFAESVSFGTATCLLAELKALLRGFQRSFAAGLRKIEVETDSALLVQFFQHHAFWP